MLIFNNWFLARRKTDLQTRVCIGRRYNAVRDWRSAAEDYEAFLKAGSESYKKRALVLCNASLPSRSLDLRILKRT